MTPAQDSGELAGSAVGPLLSALPVPVLVAHADGAIVYANARAAALFGYSLQDLMQRSVHDLVPSAAMVGHRKAVENFMRVPEAREMGAGRKLQGLRGDGSTFAVEIGLAPIELAGVSLVVALVQDVSWREEIARVREGEHRARFQGLVEAAVTASHSIRQPLQVAQGSAELALKGAQEDGQQDLLRRITAACSQIQELLVRLENVRQESMVDYIEGTPMVDLSPRKDSA